MAASGNPVLKAALALEPAALEQLAVAAVLLGARLLPLVLLAPWLLASLAPRLVQAAIWAVLVVSLLPATGGALGALPTGALPILGLCARELLLGAVLAVGLALPVIALRWAGELIEQLVHELSVQALPKPQDGPIAQLYGWLAAALFVAAGGHRLALRGLGEALHAAPLGRLAAPSDLPGLVLSSTRLLQSALEAALLIALPVMVALLLAELVLALASRLASAPLLPALAPALRPIALLTVVWMGLMTLAAMLPAWFEKALSSALALWSAP